MTQQEMEGALALALNIIKRQQKIIDELLPEDQNSTATFKPRPRRVGLLRRVK